MKLSFLPLPKRKIPAVIGIVMSLFSFGFVIAALIVSINEPLPGPEDFGVTASFALWVYSVIVAIFSLVFYMVDAVICVIRVCQRKNVMFHITMALIIVASIPMMHYVGGSLGISVLIWNLYHLTMVVFETISIVKCL